MFYAALLLITWSLIMEMKIVSHRNMLVTILINV